MAETYVELNLRLPKGREQEMTGIMEAANPGVNGDDSMFELYGRLGKGVEEMMRDSAKGAPEWLDEQLTVSEALVPQEFDSEGGLAKVQYMVGDCETGEELAGFMTDVFILAGMEVAGTYVISEHDLDECANDDEEFEHLGE